MIDCQGQRCVVSGEVTHSTVTKLLSEGEKLTGGGRVVVDLSAIEAVDSSALSLMLEWCRRARQSGTELHYSRPGPALLSLIDLYGLGEVLPLSAQ
jgi:phospholipid transport system transporter-binding protein